MIIKKANIKGFGKFIEKEVELSSGLNVVYGGNESGKTSMHAFLFAMLFGSGKRTTDRYKPWNNRAYGGTITYSLDNGEDYRIERDFASKSFKVFDSNFNDVTKNVLKKDGSLFDLGHIGVNADCFDGTLSVRQGSMILENALSESLASRLANINYEGFADVSFKEAERALKSAIRENIGTDRTFTRPLDKLNQEIETLNSSLEHIKALQMASGKSKASYYVLILAIISLPLILLGWQFSLLTILLCVVYSIEKRKSKEKEKLSNEYNKQMQVIDERIQEQEGKRQKFSDAAQALNIALNVLENTNAEMSRGFTPWLSQKTGEIIGEITLGAYQDLRINKELDLKVLNSAHDTVIPISYLSRGTIEQAFFALRFAAGDALDAQGETLPLLLDEPFAYYDDIRTQNTFELLKRESDGRQIIIFTCKTREVEIATEVFGDSLNLIDLDSLS